MTANKDIALSFGKNMTKSDKDRMMKWSGNTMNLVAYSDPGYTLDLSNTQNLVAHFELVSQLVSLPCLIKQCNGSIKHYI